MATVPVTTLQTVGRSVLIEWRDGLDVHRGTIPIEVVIDGFVDDGLLSLAIPYGVDWAYALQDAVNEITPQSLANTLHQYGIWTFNDLVSHPQQAYAALQAAYGVDFQILVKFAKQFMDGNGG